MSHVSNYILMLSPPEEDDVIIDSLFNAGVKEHQRGRGFEQVDDHAGGYKGFEANVWMFAGNYFHLQEVCGLLVAYPPDQHWNLQLLHRGQGDSSFELLTWFDIKHYAEHGE